MADCIPHIGAGAKVDDENIESKRLILESRRVDDENIDRSASVVMSIRNEFSLPFCPLDRSRKGHAS